jgi:hypothetical protein
MKIIQSMIMAGALVLALATNAQSVSPNSATGTYYLSSMPVPFPCDPYHGALPIETLDAVHHIYLVKDTPSDYATLQSAQSVVRHQMMAMNEDGNSSSQVFSPQFFTTNDLWLQIIAVTNGTANLVIHPPEDMMNGVYDLQYSTNLTLPETWQWLLRSNPRETNLMVSNATDAQGFYRLSAPNDGIANDSLGTNFWIAFNTVEDQNLGVPSVCVSSAVETSGTLTIPGLGFTNTFHIAAGASTNMVIPNPFMTAYDQIGNYGIHINTSQPVSVYAMFYLQYDSFAFTCYPTPLLGTNYCIMGSPQFYIGSEFGIVATSDNTTVTITPCTTTNLAGHSSSYTEIMQQGQTYEISSPSDATTDVTGTRVTSDKPIGVFGGSPLGSINSPLGDGNPLVQELLPVDQWGMEALAVPFYGGSSQNNYRILAAYNSTVIQTNGVVAGTIQAGQFLDLNMDGPVEFQGSNPIQVAHFASSANGGGEGGPCEVLLLPTGHYLETNIVVTLPDDYVTGDFWENFINIIVPQSTITNTFVDGSLVAATNFVAIGASGYYGMQYAVTNSGTHSVICSQPVGVEVYGFGGADAYGYFGGVVK